MFVMSGVLHLPKTLESCWSDVCFKSDGGDINRVLDLSLCNEKTLIPIFGVCPDEA